MGNKGAIGGSMNARETTAKWQKKQQQKAARFDERCKKLSGPVKTRQMKPEELTSVRYSAGLEAKDLIDSTEESGLGDIEI